MSVQNLISNYKHIREQMKRLYGELAVLRERKAILEGEIAQVLNKVDGPGIVIEGVEISVEKQSRRNRLGKKRKDEEIVRILEEHKVQDPAKVCEQLTSVGTTSERTVVRMKVKK